MNCPLCNSEENQKYYTDVNRDYLKCNNCNLVFVPFSFYLSESDEKKRYNLHINTVDNLGYVSFLNKLIIPILKKLKAKDCGLDFGSGPNPVLSLLLKNKGYLMDTYDIFFNKDNSVFLKKYDFITATEVIEHLYNPLFEIERLWKLLNVNNYLALMTTLLFDNQDFSKWYYKNDLSHVCFYSLDTFYWIADYLKAELEIIDDNVLFLKKL